MTGGVRGDTGSIPCRGWASQATSPISRPTTTRGGPEIDVIPISPLLMLRAPLVTDEEFPNGRLQPFVGVGPGIFVSLVDFDGATTTKASTSASTFTPA